MNVQTQNETTEPKKAWWDPQSGKRLDAMNLLELLALRAGLSLATSQPAEAASVLEHVDRILHARGRVGS